MATLKDLAKGYALELYKNPSKKTASDITNKINQLTYEKDNKLISQETKDELVNSIKIELKALTKAEKFEDTNFLILEKSRNFMSTASTDTSEFNDLVNLIVKGTTK